MEKKIKKISLLLLLIMILSTSLKVYAYNFVDMPTGWSKKAIENAVANGLLQGSDGKIRPNDNLTRAEVSAILSRLLGLELKTYIYYEDLSTNKWYYEDIAKAHFAGIIKGRDKYTMDPMGKLSREEAFVMLARVFKISESKDYIKSFKDSSQVSDWSKESLNAMIKEGYLKGSNGKINPKDKITRAEFAQTLYNMIDSYGRYDIKNLEVEGNLLINKPIENMKDIKVKGDLILGEGLSSSHLKMENIEIGGRLLIRGGKKVTIKGTSKLGHILKNYNTELVLEEEVEYEAYEEGEESKEVSEIRSNIDKLKTIDKNSEDYIDTVALINKGLVFAEEKMMKIPKDLEESAEKVLEEAKDKIREDLKSHIETNEDVLNRAENLKEYFNNDNRNYNKGYLYMELLKKSNDSIVAKVEKLVEDAYIIKEKTEKDPIRVESYYISFPSYLISEKAKQLHKDHAWYMANYELDAIRAYEDRDLTVKDVDSILTHNSNLCILIYILTSEDFRPEIIDYINKELNSIDIPVFVMKFFDELIDVNPKEDYVPYIEGLIEAGEKYAHLDENLKDLVERSKKLLVFHYSYADTRSYIYTLAYTIAEFGPDEIVIKK